jgi:hypothetical protein
MFLRNYFLYSFLASTDARLRDSFLQYMKNNQSCEEDHLGACVAVKCHQKAGSGRESLISTRDQRWRHDNKRYSTYVLLCIWSLSTKTPMLPFLLRSLDILWHRFSGIWTPYPLPAPRLYFPHLLIKKCAFLPIIFPPCPSLCFPIVSSIFPQQFLFLPFYFTLSSFSHPLFIFLPPNGIGRLADVTPPPPPPPRGEMA